MKEIALTVGGYTINPPGTIPGGGTNILGRIIGTGIVLLFIGVFLYALISIIFGGMQIIMSSGDKQKLANGRRRIIFAIIGLIFAFLALFFVSAIGTVFKVDLFKSLPWP